MCQGERRARQKPVRGCSGRRREGAGSGPGSGSRLGGCLDPVFGAGFGPRLGGCLDPVFGPGFGPRLGGCLDPVFGPGSGSRLGGCLDPVFGIGIGFGFGYEFGFGRNATRSMPTRGQAPRSTGRACGAGGALRRRLNKGVPEFYKTLRAIARRINIRSNGTRRFPFS